MATQDQMGKNHDSDRNRKIWLLRIIGLIIVLTIFFFLFVYPHSRLKYERIQKKYAHNSGDRIVAVASNDSVQRFAPSIYM